MTPTSNFQAPAERYFTVEEFSAMMRCSTDTVYRHIKSGLIAATRPFGRRLLIPASYQRLAGTPLTPSPEPGDTTPPNLSAYADSLTN